MPDKEDDIMAEAAATIAGLRKRHAEAGNWIKLGREDGLVDAIETLKEMHRDDPGETLGPAIDALEEMRDPECVVHQCRAEVRLSLPDPVKLRLHRAMAPYYTVQEWEPRKVGGAGFVDLEDLRLSYADAKGVFRQMVKDGRVARVMKTSVECVEIDAWREMA